VTTDLDIYRTAKLFVDQHGEDAPIHAAMRADELMAKGDLDGQAIWKLVLKAIDELLANKRPEDAGLH
jgi:hypothetical protein